MCEFYVLPNCAHREQGVVLRLPKAAQQKNVPVLLKTENNEDFVAEKVK